MLDLIMLALVVACFALARAYADLCSRLLAFVPDESQTDISQ